MKNEQEKQKAKGGYLGMNDKDAREYIEGLITGESPVSMRLLDQEAVATLKEFYAKKSITEQRLVHARTALREAESDLQQTAGAIGALTTVLFRSEAQRRKIEEDARLAAEEPPTGNDDSVEPNGASGAQTPANSVDAQP